MELEDQVSNLELSKRLKELGVKQESLWWWCRLTQEFRLLEFSKVKNLNREKYSAFTVAELGEILPLSIFEKFAQSDLSIHKHSKLWSVSYCFSKEIAPDLNIQHDKNIINYRVEDGILANAMAKMLIYLLENKLM